MSKQVAKRAIKEKAENSDTRTPLQKVPVENYRSKRTVQLFTDINKRFKLTRQYTGLSSAQFAKQLGISESMVKAIEQERVTPNINVLRLWHQKTGRSYEWILDGKSDGHLKKEG